MLGSPSFHRVPRKQGRSREQVVVLHLHRDALHGASGVLTYAVTRARQWPIERTI
jgi:hypothetical protein